MAPLLDVIFLLLTFFILMYPLMVQAKLMPVTLQEFASGQEATESALLAITIDGAGQLYVNREPIDEARLVTRLEQAAELESAPRVYVGVEAGAGQVDRAPLLLKVVEMVKAAGIEDFAFVGAPRGR